MWPFKREALATTAAPAPQGKCRWKVSQRMLEDSAQPGVAHFELTPLVGARALYVEEPFTPAKSLDGQTTMAMDDQFSAIIGDLNGYGLGSGIGFVGYGILAELAQRPEYRRGYETLAREMTRRFIKFTYAGEDEEPEEEDDDDQPDDTSKVPADPAAGPETNPAVGQEDAVPQPDDTVPKSGADPVAPQVGAPAPEKPEPRVKPSDEKLKAIEAEFKRLKVRDAFRRAAELDGCFGRGHIYIDTGDTDKAEELLTPLLADRRKIRKGKIKRLTVVEPQWMYPQNYDSRDPLKPNFYQPQQWLVMSKPVHASRIMTFVGREVPDLLKPAYSFGGLSLIQMAQPYVDNWLRTRQSVSDLLHAFTVWGIKTDMQALLGGADDSDQLIKRAQLFNQARDNRGLMMIDMEGEDFFNISVPLAGLDKLQAQAQEQMASVFAIPLVVLLGITPSGLNASSDGEIRVFYDFINAFQQHLFGHALERLLKLVQLSLFGEIDEDIGYEFLPLWQPTETDQATIRKTKMEIDTGYVNAGILDPVEVRDTLAADKEGDYNNIDVSQVPDDPNALPPGMNPITGEVDPDAAALPGGGSSGEGGDDPDEIKPPGSGLARAPSPLAPPPAGALQKPAKPPAQDEFKEADHPRAENGQFGSGGGGGDPAPSPVKSLAAMSPAEIDATIERETTREPGPRKTQEQIDREAYEATPEGAQQAISEAGNLTPENKAVLSATFKAAASAKPAYDQAMHQIARAMDGKAMLPDIKSVTRSLEKIASNYGGDASHLKDVLRGTIEVRSQADYAAAIEQVKQHFTVLPDRTGAPDIDMAPKSSGYHDVNMKVMIDGAPAEIQINTAKMLRAKETGHVLYEKYRKLEGDIKKSGEPATPEEASRLEHLNDLMLHLYSKAQS